MHEVIEHGTAKVCAHAFTQPGHQIKACHGADGHGDTDDQHKCDGLIEPRGVSAGKALIDQNLDTVAQCQLSARGKNQCGTAAISRLLWGQRNASNSRKGASDLARGGVSARCSGRTSGWRRLDGGISHGMRLISGRSKGIIVLQQFTLTTVKKIAPRGGRRCFSFYPDTPANS